MAEKIDHLVRLDAFELQRVAMLTERRMVAKEIAGTQSKKYDVNRGDFEICYVGVMGECAVAKLMRAKVDYAVYAVRDDGNDIKIRTPIALYTCQIKTRIFNPQRLDFFVNDMDAFTAQVGILAIVMSPVAVEIKGWISRDRFSQDCKTKDYGYGPRLTVDVSKLRPLDDLLIDNREFWAEYAARDKVIGK